MANLTHIRESRHLTQQELAEKSGVSVRTIQRIEAGGSLKGHTLKQLAAALGVAKEELLEPVGQAGEISLPDNKHFNQLLNLTTLLFFLPLLNILAPWLLMKWKGKKSEIGLRLIILQIAWVLLTLVLVISASLMVRWAGVSRQLSMQLFFVSALVNVGILLINAVSIARHNRLRIQLPDSAL